MQHIPLASLKPVATELAALIFAGSGDKNRMTGLLQQLSYGEVLPVKEKATRAATAKAPAIGIWTLNAATGAYERDIAHKADWPLWANVHKILPKSDKKRIVLLGESVARGYFYDPCCSLAGELEGILRHTAGLANSEVIDLARTSIQLEDLQELAAASVALQPDAVVIFAGNNWSTSVGNALGDEDYEQMHRVFQQDGVSGIKNYMEQQFAGMVTAFMQKIRHTLKDSGIPVVVVIPEFNLLDWKSDDVEKILPALPDNRTLYWLEAKAAAEAAWQQQDNGLLTAAALKMTEADPSNPLGYELLAGAYLKDNKYTEARECLGQARDTALVIRGKNSKPRCFGIVAATLAKEAAAHQMEVVHLPEVFRKALPAGIPGRDIFLDYCHLTWKGISIAMKHTAQALVKTFTGKLPEIDSIPASGLQPDKEVAAVAHFCAAIHNAHYGQPADILRYHCREAVKLSETVKDLMLQYVDFSTRQTDAVLCRTFEEIIMDGSMKQYEGGASLLHPRGRKLLDVALVDAIADALQSVGVSIHRQVTALRIKEHGLTTAKSDLLASFYSTTSYNEFVVSPKPLFFQARDTTSIFSFVTGGTEPLSFEIEYRVPATVSEGQAVRIFINEAHVVDLPLSHKWAKNIFRIPASLLKEGVNQLRIVWPYARPTGVVAGKVSARSFLNALFPALGEIQALYVMADKSARHADGQSTAVSQAALSQDH